MSSKYIYTRDSKLLNGEEKMVQQEQIKKFYTAELNPSDLYVDRRFQRPVNTAFIKRASKQGWDPTLAGYLLINETPEGLFSIIDGQHRAELAKICGVKSVNCEVHYNLSDQKAARLFHDRNWKKVNMSALDRFRVRLFQKDPKAVALNDVITRHGFYLSIGKTTKDGGLSSVSVLEDLAGIKAVGLPAVNRGLELIASTWHANYKEAMRAKFIAGVTLFCAAYPDVDLEEVSRKMSDLNPVAIYQKASGFRNRAGRFTDAYTVSWALVDHYNYGRRPASRLDPSHIPSF
jgi:hypothetical protein